MAQPGTSTPSPRPDVESIRGRRARSRGWLAALGLLGFLHFDLTSAIASTNSASVTSPTSRPTHLAITAQVMLDGNEAETRAAIRSWARVVFEEQGIVAGADAEIVSLPNLARGLRQGTVDFAAMTSDEFIRIESQISLSTLFVPAHAGGSTEEYLILVGRESKYQSMHDLEGARLGFHNHSNMSVAKVWLDVLLAREHFPAADEFFARVEFKPKAASVVLPVFFGSSDACVVSRRAYDTMVELNPQIGKRLRTLASSPEYIPGIFLLSAVYQDPNREPLLRALRDLHQTPAGVQILTLFQQARLDVAQPEVLLPVRELMAEHERLRGGSRTNGIVDHLPR